MAAATAASAPQRDEQTDRRTDKPMAVVVAIEKPTLKRQEVNNAYNNIFILIHRKTVEIIILPKMVNLSSNIAAYDFFSSRYMFQLLLLSAVIAIA